MRKLTVAAAILSAVYSVAAAAEPADLRDVDRLIFEGQESFQSRDLGNVLRGDFDVARAAHPHANLVEYLRAIERTLLVAYQHSGFRTARVEATYHHSPERIIVSVKEGSRHQCGSVQFAGCQQADTDALLKCLTSDDDPDEILWSKGHAAPFDDLTAAEIRRRIEEALAEVGLFAAKFDVEITAAPDKQLADLVVTFRNEVRRASIGKIVVTGNKRDSAEDVIRHLELSTGQPLDSQLPNRLEQRLKATGRFLSSDVQYARSSEKGSQRDEIYDLTLSLREYESAPPLAEKLLDEEQAALKLGGWAERWSRGEVEEDLVVLVTLSGQALSSLAEDVGISPAEGGDFAAQQLRLRIVSSPRRGTTIALNADAADDQPILEEIVAWSPERMLLGSPLRGAKLELKLKRLSQVKISYGTEAADPIQRKVDDRGFVFTFGLSMEDVGQANGNPIKAAIKLHPASLLDMVYGEARLPTLHGGKLTVRAPQYSAVIDAETGRPEQFIWNDTDNGLKVSITMVAGALAAEQRRIEGRLAGVTTNYDSTVPFRSAFLFVLDEYIFAREQWCKAHGHGEDRLRNQSAPWRALRNLVERWHPPMPESLIGLEDKGEQATPLNQLKLPRQMTAINFEKLRVYDLASRRNLAGILLDAHRRIAPKSGWLWPVGRDVLLAFGGESELTAKSRQALANSPEVGPVGEFVLAALDTEDALLAGWGRMSADAFRLDYDPLLTSDSWLGKWLLSLAEAARSLDDQEVRALGALIDDSNVRQMLVASLLRLKSKPSEPVAQSLAAALDELWQNGLGDRIRAALTQQIVVQSKVERLPAPESKAALGEVQSTLTDPLKRLEKLEEEITKASADQRKDLIKQPK